MNQKTRALVFTSIGHFLNDSYLVLISILIVYYLRMGISTIIIAASTAVYSVLSGLLSEPIGEVADRHGSYAALMFLGFLLMVFALVDFAFTFVAPNPWLIVAGSALLGVGAAFYHPLGGTVLQTAFRDDNAPRALGINGSMGSLGRALAPTVLVLILGALGGFSGLAVLAAYTAAIALIVYFGLRGVRCAQRSSGQVMTAQLRPFLYFILPLAAVVFVRSAFFTGVLTYAPTLMVKLYHSNTIMGLVLTVSYGLAIGGQPYFGSLTQRIGGKSVLIITTIGATASFAAFLLVKNLIVQAALFAVYSFFAYSGFPNLLGYISQVVNERSALTRVNGIIWGWGNTLGGALGSFIGGYLLGDIGAFGIMWVFLIFGIVSSAMLAILPRPKIALKKSNL